MRHYNHPLTPAPNDADNCLAYDLLPDLLVGYNGAGNRTRLSDEQDRLYFKELGHAVHYQQVGNFYWNQYVGYLALAYADFNPVLPYGRKTDEGAGLISVSEAWGKYIGNIFTARKYEDFNFSVRDFNRNELEEQRPSDDVDDDKRWIVYGMFYDMGDIGEPSFTGVTDNVDTYTTPELLRALQPDVITVRGYQQRVLQQNNNKQAVQMEQLVTSYRW